MLVRKLRYVSLCIALGAVLTLGSAEPGLAGYPERTVTLIVNSAAGGLGDVTSRIIAERLSAKWNQPVIILNRSGAGGLLSTRDTLHEPADGYHIFITDASISTNPVLRKVPGVDPRKALAPITEIGSFDFKLVVNSSLPVRTVPELIEYLKAHAGQCYFSSPGVGTPHYNIAVLFNYAAGVKPTHVPFRGTPNTILELAANRVTFSVGAFQSVAPFLKTGQIRAIATTGAHRNRATPDLPTIGETLKGFAVGSFWVALVRPEVPDDIRTKIAADMVAVIKDPAVYKKLQDLGIDPVAGTPAELYAFLDKEIKRWQAVPEGVIEKQ